MCSTNKYCDFSCAHAEFAQDAYCSDNITMYCQKAKTLVRKFAPCVVDEKKKVKKKKKE